MNGFNDQFNIPRGRFTRRIPRILIILIPVVVVISLVAVVSAQTIPAGYRGILLTWGKAEDVVLPEGLSFIIPFAQRVELMDVRIKKYTMTVLSQGRREHLPCRAFGSVGFCIRGSLAVGVGYRSVAVRG